VRTPAGDDDLAADLEFWGAPEEVLSASQEIDEEHFEVWPENWDIVVCFLAVATQWRVVPLTSMSSARLHWLGLDYTAVRARFPKLKKKAWADLQVMEQAAREQLNMPSG